MHPAPDQGFTKQMFLGATRAFRGTRLWTRAMGVWQGHIRSDGNQGKSRLGGWVGLTAALVVASGVLGCDSAEVNACHAAMTASQKSLLEVKKEDRADVARVLGEVKAAREACALAKREVEQKRVNDAVRQLENLLEALDERARRTPQKELSEDEIKTLVQKGDASCPRGEGYQVGKPPKMVRCTGKTMIEMSRSEVIHLLQADGYRLLSAPSDAIVRAEHGSKLFVVEYQDPNAPPSCIRATPKPGVPGHETASRLTGILQQRLKMGELNATPRGKVMIRVTGGGIQETVLVGECS
jgi:hypothetical protein